MADPLTIARDYRRELTTQLYELEAFIEIAEALRKLKSQSDEPDVQSAAELRAEADRTAPEFADAPEEVEPDETTDAAALSRPNASSGDFPVPPAVEPVQRRVLRKNAPFDPVRYNLFRRGTAAPA